jgi:MFS family permease
VYILTESRPNIISEEKPPNVFKELFKVRNFKLLWFGESISMVGDQFYFIALPWLVLVLTRDPLTLGTIMAIAAVPRAVFMLVGGATTDRFSPRTVMIISNLVRFILIFFMALIVIADSITMPLVYLFALSFGLGDAFFYPAQMAIIPQIVKKKQFQMANSLVMGMMQVSMFIGPVLAGFTIAFFSKSGTSTTGIGYALMIDAMTFLVSLMALSAMSIRKKVEHIKESTMDAIKKGLNYVIGDEKFKRVLLIIFIVNFLVMGPLIIGIPVIVDRRLEGPLSFGIIMTAFGGGSLLGIILAGALPKPTLSFGPVLLGLTAVMGFGLFSLAYLYSTTLVALVSLIMGISQGIVMIWGITWFQKRTDKKMMGRMMSMIMFSGAGIAPVSMAVSGVLLDWNMKWMYITFGYILIIFTLVMTTSPYVKAMGYSERVVKA